MEPIKQEIINNIFENGDKLITGPILQTVLIDMIDDVNGKDQEILSKTGSWDNAVTQIPNLATKEEVTNLSESVARDIANVDVDLTGYATEQWVQNQGYLTEHQDISGLATKSELTEAENNLQGNITSLSESVARDIANVDVDLTGYATETWVQSQDYASKTYVNDAVSSSSVDLTGYATETWVQNQGYLTEHQDISGLATKTELNDTKNNLQGNITSLSESVARDLENVDVDLTGYATETWVQNQGYLTEHQDISNLATKTELNDTKNILQSDMVTLSGSMAKSIEDSAIAIGTEIQNKDYASKTYVNDAVAGINLSDYATKTELTSVSESVQTDITNLSESVARDLANVDLTGYATEQWVQNQGYLKEHQDISGLATKTELTSVSESVQTDITNLSESVANSAVWKKGTGTDSIVQIIADGTNPPKATGSRAVATGYSTNASGSYSHAEGEGTRASGIASHAEGGMTEALGSYSHAEGYQAYTLRDYSHAEGYATNASGKYSHVEGLITYTSGDYSHAEGAYTKASASCSHTEGNFTNTLGDYSHAEGAYTTASGEASHAEGRFTTASGWYSHTEGHGTTTSGNSSHAEGAYTIASGSFSHAEGAYTTTSGDYSHAEGDHTNASGYISHAEGAGTTALGQYSHAEGQNTNASGFGSHTEGAGTTALGQYSHAEGDNSRTEGMNSHAEGSHTNTSNDYEHAQGRYNHNSSNQIFSIGTGNSDTDRRNAVSVLEVDNSGSYTSSFFVQNVGGYDGTNPTPGTNDLATVINNLPSGGGSSETLWKKGTGKDSIVQVVTGDDEANTSVASGVGAIAIGSQTTASGLYSYAEGSNTLASGWYSHAEGSWTTASGLASHAEGDTSNASGLASHAEGQITLSSGQSSHAEGFNTIASNDCEHAQGRYNHSSTNQIFSIGTGNNSEDRRNAVSVLEVSNNNSYTSSFFVQNIGGYDGTNPTPGTNDLATVINGMSSGGGTGDYLPLTGGTLTGDLQVNSSMGVGTGPQGTNCLAVGDSNTNTQGSHYALAVGENCQVEGAYGGVSLGRENVVNAAFGLATGFRCRTTSMSGYAGGCRSTASANFAFAAGFGAEATRVGQVVLGSYNELDPSGDNESTGSYAVILANGKSNTWHQDYPGDITRSNGLAIKWDGGIDIKYRDSTITLQDKLNEIESRISSGGTGTSTETWTFTLDNGSTVTKNVIIA